MAKYDYRVRFLEWYQNFKLDPCDKGSKKKEHELSISIEECELMKQKMTEFIAGVNVLDDGQQVTESRNTMMDAGVFIAKSLGTIVNQTDIVSKNNDVLLGEALTEFVNGLTKNKSKRISSDMDLSKTFSK